MEPLSGRAPRDQNRAPALFAIDTTTGLSTVPLEANPATGALLVETVTAGGAVVAGNKSNNNAVPGSNNLGVLPGIANAAVQTWTEGNQVLESMDLSGNQRMTMGTQLDSTNDSVTASNVTGTVADGVAATGNPVRVGGVVSSSDKSYSNGQLGSLRMGTDGTLYTRIHQGNNDAAVSGALSDGDSNGNSSLYVVAKPELYNGSSWDRERTPTTFNSAQATSSGDTAVWTPTTGKKFRIMRFKVQVTANAVTSGGGVITIKLRDSTTDLNLTHDVYVPAAAATALVGDYDSGWIDLGNGKLSAATNNVLNVNLSAAITTGNVRVIVAGTEE